MVAHEKRIPDIGKAIRAAREHKGLSQIDLAEDAGISKGVIQGAESGGTMPRLEHLTYIAWALGMSVSALVIRAEELA